MKTLHILNTSSGKFKVYLYNEQSLVIKILDLDNIAYKTMTAVSK